jgi:hypothetical protein
VVNVNCQRREICESWGGLAIVPVATKTKISSFSNTTR